MCAEISSHTLWLTVVPTDSQAWKVQKTWVARQRHQNMERCVRDTWLSTHLRAVYAVGPSWLKPQLTIGVVSFHVCLQHYSISCSDYGHCTVALFCTPGKPLTRCTASVVATVQHRQYAGVRFGPTAKNPLTWTVDTETPEQRSVLSSASFCDKGNGRSGYTRTERLLDQLKVFQHDLLHWNREMVTHTTAAVTGWACG
jgi:hypothetical protein